MGEEKLTREIIYKDAYLFSSILQMIKGVSTSNVDYLL